MNENSSRDWLIELGRQKDLASRILSATRFNLRTSLLCSAVGRKESGDCMSWNAKLIDTFLSSFVVCSAAAGLALLIGLILALLTRCLRVPTSPMLGTALLSLVFVPIYVQATAWSAGFGLQGWLRFSQVAAAISPAQAMFSVVWIHGTAISPICYLLCSMGIARAIDTDTRQALMDFGSRYAVTQVLIPKLGPWIAACFLISVALIGNDMVVTNLFQVPTLTESLYQQVQFNEIRIWSVLASCSFVFLLGIVVWSTAIKSIAFLGPERSGGNQPANSDTFAIQGYWKWLGAFVGWLVVCLVVLVPVANLIAKAGWVARAEPQGIQRGWSVSRFAESILELGSFRAELVWSLQLSLYATGFALALGIFSVSLAKSRWSSSIWIACMAMLLATPGPLINLVLIKLSNSVQTDFLIYLADRTIAIPILALQSRCWPIAFGILWVAQQRFSLRHQHQMAIDLGLPFSTRFWVRAQAMTLPILTSALVCFFVSFADLSSYLLVLPPGVTTVSMRMFDLLHYGVKNQDASLALGLAVCGMLASVLLLRKTK